MQWLIANMWMALAAAAVLGLLFGFSFRGVMSSNRVRRAEIEREIARTELTQSKAEAEALYAAQRKRKEESAQLASGDDTLQTELTERENRITALGEELRGARSELDALKSKTSGDSNRGEMAGAAIAGAVAGAVLSDDDQEELTKLRDRNTWLEERVTALETDIAAQSTSEPAIVAAAIDGADEAASGPNIEKLNWQSTYMRQRVAALESKLIETTAAASGAEVASEQVAELVAAPTPEPEVDTETSGEVDEELAQLRWRNRYLEGRLAYFEQTPDGEDGEAEAETEAPKLVEEAAEISELEPEQESEPEADTALDVEPEPEPEETVEEPSASEDDVDAAVAADDEVHPSEAMLAELEGTQPEQVEQPDSGGDDLTTITGIGPRIAEVLNSLGIWTYSQIAEWRPEHETWIENHLSFKGRVSRENWVGQAKDLLVSA